MSKKYYWLKLKEDFFRDKKIKKLRKIAGGDTYTIIYLKMQLLSLKNDGALIFEGVEDNFAEEIALEIDEDIENVKVTIAFLMGNGLIEELEQDHFVMTETIKCIGSETASAERVRKHRELKKEKEQKALQCNTGVTNGNTEIEKREKSKELENKIKEIKRKYGEYQNVKLTEKEFNSLVSEFGSSSTNEFITYLDEYIEMKGVKYKSCYLAIRKWVIKAVKEKGSKTTKQPIRKEVIPEWHGKEPQSENMTPEEKEAFEKEKAEIERLLKEIY